MKKSCGIIKDLLPLYLDGVCSNESKEAIEEHLLTCDSCKAECQNMSKSLPLNHSKQNLKEAEAVKNLSKKWKKGMLQSACKGIVYTILAFAALALAAYLFLDFKFVIS